LRRWRKRKAVTKALNNCKVIKKRGTIDPLDTSLTEKKLKDKKFIKNIQPISVGVRGLAMFKEQWSKRPKTLT
jgi:hypothetical protein